MYDYLRVTSAVPTVSVANPEKNKDYILKMLSDISNDKTDIAAFPELCITGYSCGDLFFQKNLLLGALKSLGDIVKKSKDYDFAIIVGLPLEIENKILNAAAVISDGKVLGIVPKTFIPNHNEFCEKRWFASSTEIECREISSEILCLDENYVIPVGSDLVFVLDEGIKFSVEICEDLWSPVSPSSFSLLSGAELVVNISASNETVSKRKYRRNLVSAVSAEYTAAYLFTSAGSGESTTDLIFSGHSIIAENGDIIAENKNIIDDDYFLTADIDIGKIRADRIKSTTFRDASVLYGKIVIPRCVDCKSFKIKSDGSLAKINKMPFVPLDKSEREERCSSIFEMQTEGLKKRLEVMGAKPVVGVSGGLDSTLALLVSVKATEKMGRKASDVVGITLPCFGTSDRTYTNALMLMEKLGITVKEINIKDACIAHFKDIGQDLENYDLTYENSQARERTQVLMDYCGKIGGLVVGTGDLSELALGWCTYNGDHMSMYGVNAGIPKTLVRWMVNTIADMDIFEGCGEILKDIAATPISPELIPPDKSGDILQKTEDIVGPYELHDFFIYNVLRYGFEPKKVFALALSAFKDDYDRETILKWLKNFYRRFFTQQFKRSCMPDGVKIGRVGLSPRGDWHMPSDASSAKWLDDVERLC